MTNALAARLTEALPELRGKGHASPAARGVVQEAGQSGDASLRPLLREVAQSVHSDANRSVIYSALHGLWRLGEGSEYFLQNAKGHSENKWLAYYSILILGRDPTDTAVQSTLEEIAAQTTDNQILGAIAEYGRARHLRQRYARYSKLASKVGFILSHFQGYWNPVFFETAADPSSEAPEAAWLEKELRELSQAAPDEVARLIYEADMSDLYPDPEARSDWCQHMAGLLAPDAGAALRALVAAKKGDVSEH